jgi:Clp amino terminal domain, pathogenicity island component
MNQNHDRRRRAAARAVLAAAEVLDYDSFLAMFERYTEKARRVIFFARYEASQFGAPYIETEHLLLGLLREDKALAFRFLATQSNFESIRQQVQNSTPVREQVSTSVDLPLSNESKRILAYAAEEAERLSHKWIGTEHLLLGIMREEKCFAAELLNERGLRLSAIREELSRHPHAPTGMGGGVSAAASSRRVAPRAVELINDSDGVLIAKMPYVVLNMPLVGDEIVVGDSKFRVTRLVHHFTKDEHEEQAINPEKIEIRVVPLAS